MAPFGFFKRRPKPLVIQDALGTFTLQNPAKDKFYKGTIQWLGTAAPVRLEPDDPETLRADAALENLREIVNHAAEWDRNIRQYAAEEMAEEDGMIETWQETADGSPLAVTKEEFIRRISMGFIYIHAGGDVFFDYGLDDMFTDHGLEIHAHIPGGIEYCGIWG